ncbi:MAG: hypothetical protein PVI38_07395 [Desulfobacterales bacterium]
MPLKLAALVQRFLNKFEVGGAAVIRLQCLAGAAFGAFLLWSVSPGLGAA